MTKLQNTYKELRMRLDELDRLERETEPCVEINEDDLEFAMWLRRRRRVSEMQKVYLSRTQSGAPGLFTNNFISWHLTEEQYARFQQDKDALREFCRVRRFELDEGE